MESSEEAVPSAESVLLLVDPSSDWLLVLFPLSVLLPLPEFTALSVLFSLLVLLDELAESDEVTSSPLVPELPPVPELPLEFEPPELPPTPVSELVFSEALISTENLMLSLIPLILSSIVYVKSYDPA